jgi:hypothetical protein
MSDLPILDFRLATNSKRDAENFCALSNSLYARPVNEAYYTWQFFECPFPSLLNVAVDRNDRILGTYALHIQNKIAWVLDIMVSPTVQRRGVFKQLVDFGFENLRKFDVNAIVVMANENANRACVDGLGWTRINTLYTYFAEPYPTDRNQRFEVGSVADFSSIDLSAHSKNRISNQRTSEYQNWRFFRNARYSYDVFSFSESGADVGYVVLKTFKDPVSGNSFGDIVDLFWAEENPDLIKEMVAFSLDYFHQLNIATTAIWLQTNTILDAVGLEAGFVRSNQPRYFCGKAITEIGKVAELPENWFLNMSDSEVY